MLIIDSKVGFQHFEWLAESMAFFCNLGFLIAQDQRKLIAHQCCDQSWIISMDQLTAVKTRYPLTSITWPYRGLRCRPIEVEYFFEVIRWQVTSFQKIADSSLFLKKIHMKYVVFMSLRFRTIRKKNSASYLEIQAGKTFSYQGHALVTLYV